MDLNALSDEELDALQLAVNVELGARRLRSRMAQRVARIIAEAEDHGLPEDVVSAAFVDGKAIALAHREDSSGDTGRVPAEKFTATSASAGAVDGDRGNTIGKSTPQSP